MKQDEFIKLGLDEETAKKCETASTVELKGYISKIEFKEVVDAKIVLEQAVADRDGQLEILKNSPDDVATLKATIETLQTDNANKATAHADAIKQLKMNAAVERAITGAKGKNAKAIKALLELTDAEIGEDGSIKGLAEQMVTLQKAEDSKFLFVTESKPQLKGATPGESGKEGADGKADTAHMTYAQLCAHMEENNNAPLEQ